MPQATDYDEDWRDYDYQQYEIEKPSADEGEMVICSACNGSGEGMYDGSVCDTCGGSGEVFEAFPLENPSDESDES